MVELDELLELLIMHMLVGTMGADSVVGLVRVAAEWAEAEVVEKSSVIGGTSSSSSEKVIHLERWLSVPGVALENK